MSEGEGAEGRPDTATHAGGMLEEHAAVMGRVAMALLGDPAQVERALEQAAREAGTSKPPEGVKPVAWLLGLVRGACATQLSKLPLRTRASTGDRAPVTERLGAGDAVPARAALAALKPTEREAVVLSLVGGLEATDVAVACNVDVDTARARIARGVEQLLENAAAEEGGAR